MELPALLSELTKLGVRLKTSEDRLCYSPRNAVNPEIEVALQVYRQELLVLVKSEPQSSESNTQKDILSLDVDREVTRLPYVCGFCRRRVVLVLMHPGMYSYRCVCRNGHGKVSVRDYHILLRYEAMRQEQRLQQTQGSKEAN